MTWTAFGGEVLVNTTTKNGQQLPSIAALTGGGFVVTWEDQATSGDDQSGSAVRGQQYNSSGTKVGGEFLVNTTTTNGQLQASATALTTGGFVVTWLDNSATGGDASGGAVRGQRYDANGDKDGAEFLVNATTTNDQDGPSVAGIAGGGFTVTWRDKSASGSDTSGFAVRAQRYAANGDKDGIEFLVNATTSANQEAPSVAALADGGFVVTWSDYSASGSDSDSGAIRGQRYDSTGATVGSEFMVNTTTTKSQYEPSVIGLTGGGFVVLFRDDSGTGGDTSSTAVRGQQFDSTGAKIGSEFLVNTTTNSYQGDPAVAALPGGGFVVTWTDYSGTGGDTSSGAVRGQIYSATGAAIGAEFLINSTTSGTQGGATVAALTAGGFVVTWGDASATGGDKSGSAVRSQMYQFGAPGAVVLDAASDTGTSASDRITADTTPTISGTGTSGVQVKLFNGATEVGSTTVAANGSWSITSSSLAEGAYGLTAKGYSGTTVSPVSSTVTVTIDATAPSAPGTITLAAPSDTGLSSTDRVTTATKLQLSGTAEANSAVSVFDGASQVGTATTDGAGAWSLTTSTLAEGTRSLTAKATDIAGNLSAASAALEVTIVGAASAPTGLALATASDTGTLATDRITNDTTPTITGMAGANATVALYDGATALGTATADGTGAWSITSSVLAQGTYSLTATAAYPAGTVSPASTGVTITLDTTAPAAPGAITLSAASDSGLSTTDRITSATLLAVFGTAEANSVVTVFNGASQVGTATADGTGAWSLTTSALTVGTRSLTAKAKDLAGNLSAASAALEVTIVGAASVPTGLALAVASDTGTLATDRVTNDTTPTITGTADANASITLYNGATALGTATADGTGAWSVTSSALGEGTYTLTAKAANAAGEASVASTGVAITIDTTAPGAPEGVALAFASDTGTVGDGVTQKTTPEIIGTAEAGATVRLFSGATEIGNATAGGTGAWSIVSGTLAIATHTVTATASDIAGNVSAPSKAFALTIEAATAPAPAPAPAPAGGGGGGGPSAPSITLWPETKIIVGPGGMLSEDLGTPGTDTVWLGTSGILPSKIENAVAITNGAITLIGNSSANSLIGSPWSDTLDGSIGDDTIVGCLGVDFIVGGPGNDEIVGDLVSRATASFTCTSYLEFNADVKAAGGDAFRHWVFFGQYEERTGAMTAPAAGAGLLFDPRGYLQRNPDVAAAGVDPLEHFIAFGAGEERAANSKSKAFDHSFYLAENPDVAVAGVDPFQHFLTFGGVEGRAPSPLFDSAAYWRANPDVAAAEANALMHFLRFGMAEGRTAYAVPRPDTFRFDVASGHDRVLDFQPTIDKLSLPANITGGGPTTAAALLQAAQQVGSDVFIDFGGGSSVTLVGVTLASLSPANILLT